MSELNGKNKWVNLRKVMTDIWSKNGIIMSSTLMDDMAEKHNGMFGQVVKEIS